MQLNRTDCVLDVLEDNESKTKALGSPVVNVIIKPGSSQSYRREVEDIPTDLRKDYVP
jgi:hypothetical protein